MNPFYILCVLFIALLFNSNAKADWSLAPGLRLQSLDYADPLNPAVNQHLLSGRASADFQWRPSHLVKIKADGYVQADPWNNSSRETFFGDVPNGYLEIKRGFYSLQVGENTFTWAGTDGFNPVDVVNARRYFDPIHAEKLGSPSASLRGGWDFLDWQLIYIPQQTKSQLPGENSRWLPRDIYIPQSSGQEFILPSVLQYNYSPDQELGSALENNFGARLDFHILGSELALLYFDGSALTPAIVPSVSGQVSFSGSNIVVNANSNISLQPFYYRHKLYGVTEVAPLIDDTLLRVVLAFDQPSVVGLDVPTWSNNYVAGLEHNFSVGKGTLTFVPQYSYGQHGDSSGNEVSSLSRIFDRALIVGMRYAPTEALTISPAYIGDLLTNGNYVSLETDYRFSDHFKGDITGELFLGASGTILGTYSRNSRATTGIGYSF